MGERAVHSSRHGGWKAWPHASVFTSSVALMSQMQMQQNLRSCAHERSLISDTHHTQTSIAHTHTHTHTHADAQHNTYISKGFLGAAESSHFWMRLVWMSRRSHSALSASSSGK